MKARAILLDAGETLITPRSSLSAQLASALPHHAGLDARAVRAAFEDAWTERSAPIPAGEERYKSVPGGSGQFWREVIVDTFRRVDVAVAPDEADQLYARLCASSSWKVFPEVVATLERLRARGLRLAIASNWDRGLTSILEGLDLARHFDAFGISEELGYEKPAGEFFAAVLERVGVAPGEAVHVGDRMFDDIEGARGAGIPAFLIDRHARFEDAPWVVRSLAELPDRLAS